MLLVIMHILQIQTYYYKTNHTTDVTVHTYYLPVYFVKYCSHRKKYKRPYVDINVMQAYKRFV